MHLILEVWWYLTLLSQLWFHSTIDMYGDDKVTNLTIYEKDIANVWTIALLFLYTS